MVSNLSGIDGGCVGRHHKLDAEHERVGRMYNLLHHSYELDYAHALRPDDENNSMAVVAEHLVHRNPKSQGWESDVSIAVVTSSAETSSFMVGCSSVTRTVWTERCVSAGMAVSGLCQLSGAF